jgi:Putative beta-barrel porin-2, OmpL-like. bbp2
MVKNLKLLIIALGFFVSVQAQDTTKAVIKTDTLPPPNPPSSFTGSVDLYYRYNFSNPKAVPWNNYTSFTSSQNSFELGMVSLKYDHTWGKAGVSAELGFGRRAQDFSYNDGTTNPYFSLANVVQAYVFYNVTDKIKLTAGKWATHIGYELVDAYLNRNYSMSYMFSKGPFFNTGLKADVAIAGKTAFMVGISNATDHSTVSNDYQSFIAQVSTATPDSKWKFYLNYQGGMVAKGTTLNQFDLVVTGTVSDKFSIGVNGTEQTFSGDSVASSATWWGAALYLNWDPSSVFGMTLRSEYFSNKDNALDMSPAVDPGNFTEFTLTGQIKLGKLTVMPELRYDAYSSSLSGAPDQAFLEKNGSPTNNTFTGLIAATYVF